uniref:hypothetical protein n=1 Tax=Polynucleobacter sp. TaxID=2029855 RepID=UPI004047E202
MTVFRLFLKLFAAIFALGQLSACALVAAYPLTAVSISTTVTTGKSLTDHAASEGTGHDCSVMRVFEDKNVCEKHLKPSEVPVQDFSRRQRVVPN